jgi:L-2-amino-thiazoline-4-carboxylic acid hydrolase
MQAAIYRRGLAIGQRFAEFGPSDLERLRDACLEFAPDQGRLFQPEVRCDAGGLDIKFHACPLKEAWRPAGFPPEKIATLCRIAGVVDDGTFEAAGFNLFARPGSRAKRAAASALLPEACLSERRSRGRVVSARRAGRQRGFPRPGQGVILNSLPDHHDRHAVGPFETTGVDALRPDPRRRPTRRPPAANAAGAASCGSLQRHRAPPAPERPPARHRRSRSPKC